MGRVKIIGHDRCPHVNRKSKTGKHCNKLGRYSSKPMVTWNTKLKFDEQRKRRYFQFIHNDGTRHNIGSMQDDEQQGGSQSGSTTGTRTKKDIRLYNTIKKAALTTGWLIDLKSAEFDYITNQFKAGNSGPLIESFRAYDGQRRRIIYERSHGVERELWWYRQSHVYDIYDAIRDFVTIDVPLDEALLQRVLRPETASTIVEEKRKLLKGQLLRLQDAKELLTAIK